MPIDSPVMPSTPAPHPHRSADRRGVILIFVVVFLVLLAIIGAAFVSASRIDRMQIGNLGGRNIERDPNIRDIYDQAVEAVLQKLEDDITRNDGFDDDFMASLLPRLLVDTDTSGGVVDSLVPVWPKIGEPLSGGFGEDFFVQTPYFVSGTGWTQWGTSADEARRVGVGDVQVQWAESATVRRFRAMPGLRPFTGTNLTPRNFYDGTNTNAPSTFTGSYLAGDADGDGIADSGLTPVVLDDTFPVDNINRYQRDGIVYFVGYRVVDKNAQVNVNTAGSRDGLLVDVNGNDNVDNGADINYHALSDAADSSLASGNVFGPTFAVPERYGLFLHDVGLIELFEFSGLNSAVINPGTPDAQYAAHREFMELARSRYGLNNDEGGFQMTPGQLSSVPLDVYNNQYNADSIYRAGDPEGRTDFFLRGLGDLSEQKLARRILAPGVFLESSGWETTPASDADQGTYAVAYPSGDSDMLSYKGGFRPKYGDSAVAEDLKNSVLYPDINHSQGRGPNVDQPYSGQPYAALIPNNGTLRRYNRLAQSNQVPIGVGELFDPNVFPAYEHDVWSGGARALFDDPEYATYLGGGAINDQAFTWRFLSGYTLNDVNGRDPGTPTLNGVNTAPTDRGRFRPIRPLLTTVNGFTPEVTPVELFTLADNAGAGDAGATYGPPALQSLARTYRLLEWTADPVYLVNPDIGTANDDITPVAASGNTSSVRDLTRAYFHLFADPANRNPIGLPLPKGYDGTLDGGGLDLPAGSESTFFRNVMRYPESAADTPGLSPSQVAVLRAAILAVNTKDLRDADNDVTVKVIDLGPASVDADGNGNRIWGDDPAEYSYADNITAVVYGVERQPFITEVMVWNDISNGGIATQVMVEIYNPTTQAIDLSEWQLVASGRDATAGAEERVDPTATQVIDLAGLTTPIIGPGEFRVIASTAVDGTSPTATPVTPDLEDADLASFAGFELMLMRPAAEAGIGTVQLAGEEQRTDEVTGGLGLTPIEYTESAAPAAVQTLIPVDQVDLTGMDAEDVRFYYARSTESWEMVYPGRYFTDDIPAASPNTGPGVTFGAVGASEYRSTELDGVPQSDVIVQDLNDAGYRDYGDPGYLSTYVPTFGAANVSPSLESLGSYPAIQVQNFRDDLGADYDANQGTTLDTAPATDRIFPFGMFARDLDLLQVTMFGSYKLIVSPPVGAILSEDAGVIEGAIDGSTGRVLEFNSPTMDLALLLPADPITAIDPDGPGPLPAAALGFPDNPGRLDPKNDTLGYVLGASDQFSAQLFDYIHAHQGAGHDYFPMVRPEEWGPLTSTLGAASPYDYTLAAGPSNLPAAAPGTQMPPAAYVVAPKPIDNDSTIRTPNGLVNANNDAERRLPIQGRINVATAPPEVLAMLPLVVNPDGTVNQDQTRKLAYEIANYRDGLVPATYSGSGPDAQFLADTEDYVSIFDLLDADDGVGTVDASTGDTVAGDADTERLAKGDFSAFDAVAGTQIGSAGDFEVKYNRINRISNLTTTKSDSYDVYVVVQAWRINTGDQSENRLIDERRGQFRVARTGSAGAFLTTPFAVPPKE